MLTQARDSEFWRQRIFKEQKHGFMKQPVVQEPYLPPPAFATQFLTAGPPAFQQVFNKAPQMASVTVQPTNSEPFRPTVPPAWPRSPPLAEALQKGWQEPPLIMSGSFAEPPRVFRKYLEASTHSVHKPPVPVLHWKN